MYEAFMRDLYYSREIFDRKAFSAKGQDYGIPGSIKRRGKKKGKAKGRKKRK